jgi:hypothetical protein
VLELVMRQPTVLLIDPDALRGKVAALQRLLGGADYQVALMLLAKQPSLAGFRPEALEAKHAAACAAAGLAPATVRRRGRARGAGAGAVAWGAAARAAAPQRGRGGALLKPALED